MQVAEQGSQSDFLYRVINGWVLLSHDSSSGDRTVLDVVVSGETFGLPGETEGLLYYSAVALTQVTVCMIAHARLDKLRHQCPGFEEMLLRDAVSRLARRQRQAVYTAHGCAKARVAAFLLDAYQRGRAGSTQYDPSQVPLRQLDIADATGITAPYANRVLNALSTDGALTLQRGYLRIDDEDRLQTIAAQAFD
jgi:CRP-like cAMP-binding protein